MKRNPDSRPRPDANALNEVDTTEDEVVPDLDAEDIPEELGSSDVPALDVVHAHDEAVEIATEQSLTEPETTKLIRRRQQENHERTKLEIGVQNGPTSGG